MPGDKRQMPRPPSSTFREQLRNWCWNTFGQPWSLTLCTMLRKLMNMLQCKNLAKTPFNKEISSWEPGMIAAYSFRSLPVWWSCVKRAENLRRTGKEDALRPTLLCSMFPQNVQKKNTLKFGQISCNQFSILKEGLHEQTHCMWW